VARKQRIIWDRKIPRWLAIVDAVTGFVFQQYGLSQVQVYEFAERLIDPRPAGLIGVLRTLRMAPTGPAVLPGCALEEAQQSLNLGPEPVDLVKLAIVVTIKPSYESRYGGMVSASSLAKPAFFEGGYDVTPVNRAT
jgi:hypothetical protein